MADMQRRALVKGAAASLMLLSTPFSLAGTGSKQPKVVWVVLRGAMDGMHAVIPAFDPMLLEHRPQLAKSTIDSSFLLEKGYRLHPELKQLYSWYQDKQASFVVAVGSGYPSRSHFDGQDYLESAGHGQESGWLARALQAHKGSAVAITQATPISLRGATAPVTTWYPSRLKDNSEDTYEAILSMYQEDAMLQQAFAQGLELKMKAMMGESAKQNGQFVSLAQGCGRLIKGSSDIDCAMLEMGGWDTHNNQAGRLSRQFSTLDKGLEALKQALGSEWDNTLVIVATEFGRTVRQNGTLGTDHGTASMMMFAGGGLKSGGRVQGQWPGLEPEQLFEGRDLAPTSNMYDRISERLAPHWQVSEAQLRKLIG